MDKVIVYDFIQYDSKTDQTKHSKRPATRETILGLFPPVTLLEETAQEVDVSQIDENGFLKKS